MIYREYERNSRSFKRFWRGQNSVDAHQANRHHPARLHKLVLVRGSPVLVSVELHGELVHEQVGLLGLLPSSYRGPDVEAGEVGFCTNIFCLLSVCLRGVLFVFVVGQLDSFLLSCKGF